MEAPNHFAMIDDGAPLDIDLQRLVSTNACVMANPGGGKSGLIRRLLETTAGRVQQIILDAEDEFYTLRERFPFMIAGGENGDVPVSVAGAPALAETLLKHSISAVIQINQLTDQQQFVASFIERVMELPRSFWHPVLFVVDEAQRFAPQDEYAASLDAMKDLVGRGRKRGYTAIFATPRLARIDKNVTHAINNWFIGRVGQGTDRRVAADALGFGPSSQEARGLISMPNRMFWGFGPAVAPQPTLLRVEPCSTTIIEAGQASVPTPPPPAAMKALLQSLAEAARAAEAPETPTNPAAPAQPMSDAEHDRISKEARAVGYVEGMAAGQSIGFSGALAELRPVISRLEAMAYGDEFAEVDERPARLSAMALHEGDTVRLEGDKVMEVIRSNYGVAMEAERSADMQDGEFSPSPAQQRIIDKIAWCAAFKVPASRIVVAALANYKPTGGGFRNYLGSLRTAGVISYPQPEMLALTPSGARLAAKPTKVLTNQEIQAAILSAFEPAPRRILNALIEAYPEAVSRDELAKDTGYEATGGGFRNYLGRLRTFGVATYPKDKTVRAADILFPLGAGQR